MSLSICHSRLLLGFAFATLFATQAVAERLLTGTEGSAVAQEAIRYEGARRFTDCSHFVHRVFASLGLEYAYATSNQLYRGSDAFEHVRRPQAGDLIVWRGHVGVVVDPDERTFFSAVTSGMRTHSYSSPYWTRRGKPRFYRYLLASAAPPQLIAAASHPPSKARKQAGSRNPSPALNTKLSRKLASAALRVAGRRNRPARAAAAAATILMRP